MSDRINTPFTNEHFVAFCLSMLGQPYWYGTVVYKCTENLRSSQGEAVSVALRLQPYQPVQGRHCEKEGLRGLRRTHQGVLLDRRR